MASPGTAAAALSGIILCGAAVAVEAFAPPRREIAGPSLGGLTFVGRVARRRALQPLMIYAPPGSGYVEPEDEIDYYPDTYEPMMEYPVTMRPGRVSENQAYENLPCGDDDPDPVPWPHFQEIEWHHQWEPPHPHPVPMEEFIEQQGRWATVEEEAQMRMDVRRGVRERRELEELEKAGASTLIVDEDDDDEEDEPTTQLELGSGVDSIMGAAEKVSKERVKVQEEEVEEEEEEEEEVDFLLDLGLDVVDDDADEDSADTSAGDDGDEPAFATGGQRPEDLLSAMQSMIDMEGDGDGDGDDGDEDIDLDIDLGLLDDDDVAGPTEDGDGNDIEVEENDDMGITMIGDDDDFVVGGGGGEDDMGGGFQTIPLDEFSGNEDMGDEEGFFDDGGFDYD